MIFCVEKVSLRSKKPRRLDKVTTPTFAIANTFEGSQPELSYDLTNKNMEK
jgi:hypothetical protein